MISESVMSETQITELLLMFCKNFEKYQTQNSTSRHLGEFTPEDKKKHKIPDTHRW